MAPSKQKQEPAPAARPADRRGRIEAAFLSPRRLEWRSIAEADLDAAPDSPDLYKAALSDPRRH